jgi:23S rRNA-/tRNA-specific pseudouridylate synthase
VLPELHIVHRDKRFLAVNKPSGMLCSTVDDGSGGSPTDIALDEIVPMSASLKTGRRCVHVFVHGVRVCAS